MRVTNKVNQLRKYMFIARTTGISDKLVDIDAFTELDNPNEFVEVETKFSMRIRLNPDMYPKPLMITGENLEMDHQGLDDFLNLMTEPQLKRFLKRAEF